MILPGAQNGGSVTELGAIYDEAAYDLSLDYDQVPTPAFCKADTDWLQAQLQNA